MKKLLFVLLFIVPIAAQVDSNIEEHVNKIFKLSKDKDYKNACALIAYKGENPDRKYISPLNPKNKNELELAERTIKKIKAYLDISDSYDIQGAANETADNLELTTITVSFKSGGQELKIPFKFVRTGEKYLLVSID